MRSPILSPERVQAIVFVNHLFAWERLARLPTRYLTGHFVAVTARPRANGRGATPAVTKTFKVV
jgi:hypothetical protein